jgi:hypothetical protein
MACSATPSSKQLEERDEWDRAGESRAESCTGASVHGQEHRIDGGGICGGGGTWIDTAEAVDVYYPGFFQRTAGLGTGSLMGSLLRFQCS